MAKRAPILKVGACEPLDEGTWFVQGWRFDCLGLIAPVTATTSGELLLAGWRLPELQEIANAEMELAALPTVVAHR